MANQPNRVIIGLSSTFLLAFVIDYLQLIVWGRKYGNQFYRLGHPELVLCCIHTLAIHILHILYMHVLYSELCMYYRTFLQLHTRKAKGAVDDTFWAVHVFLQRYHFAIWLSNYLFNLYFH